MLVIPLALFLSGLPDRTRCGLNSYEVGSPIASAYDTPHYVRSFAEIVNPKNTVVGWVYLADDGFGHGISEYVQGNEKKSQDMRKAFATIWPKRSSVSSVVKLRSGWPLIALSVRRCADIVRAVARR